MNSDEENEERRLGDLKTIAEVNEEYNKLRLEFNILKKLKANGNNVEKDFKKLEKKFDIIEAVKNRLSGSAKIGRKISVGSAKSEIIRDEVKKDDKEEAKKSRSIRTPDLRREKKFCCRGSTAVFPALTRQSYTNPKSSYLLDPKIEICIGIDSQNPWMSENKIFQIINQINIESIVSVAFLIWSSSPHNLIEASKLLRIGRPKLARSGFNFESRNPTSLQQEINNVNWSNDSIKCFVYFKKTDSDQLNNIIAENVANDLIANKRIHIKEIFGSIGLNDEQSQANTLESFEQLIEGLKRYRFNYELNNLKRCLVNSELESLKEFSNNRTRCLTSEYELSSARLMFRKCNCQLNDSSEGNVRIEADEEIHSLKIEEKIRSIAVSEYSRAAHVRIKLAMRKKLWKISYTSNVSDLVVLERVDLNESSRLHVNMIYLTMMKAFLTTQKLAHEFNNRTKERVREPANSFSVHVPEAFLIKDKRGNSEATQLGIKTSDLPKLTLDSNDEEFRKCRDAFTHFTYEFTDKKFLIIDLRTTLDTTWRQMALNEPVIFSREQNFGSADLGIDGIDWFMKNHQCMLCDIWKR